MAREFQIGTLGQLVRLLCFRSQLLRVRLIVCIARSKTTFDSVQEATAPLELVVV